MSDVMDLATRLAVLAYIAGQVNAARKEQLGPQFVQTCAPGARLPAKIGGTLIGWVSVPKPARKAAVTNEARFLAWVRENAATEIVEAVRPSFAQLVLRTVKERGGWIDKRTGEIIPVPGIEVTQGDPYAKADLEDCAGEVIAAAWRDLDLGGMVTPATAIEASDAA